MHTRAWPPALALLLASGAAAGAAGRAHACQPAPCVPGIRLGPTAPANLAGFVVDDSYRFGWTLGREPTVALLDEATGEAVGLAPGVVGSGLRLQRLVDRLVPGRSYRVRYDQMCSGGPAVQEAAFVATEPAPLPNALGTLRVAAQTMMAWDGNDLSEGLGRDGSTSCTADLRAAVAEVELVPSPELTAWADVVRVDLVVDGVVVDRPPADTPWSPRAGGFGELRFGRTRAAVWLACPPGSTETRTREVRVRGRLDGHDWERSTPVVAVSLRCDPAETDAGGVAGAVDGSSEPPSLAEAEPSCGCAATRPAGEDASALGLAVLIAALAHLTARRRSA